MLWISVPIFKRFLVNTDLFSFYAVIRCMKMIGIKNECVTPEQQKRKHPTVGKKSNDSRIRQDLCIVLDDCFKKIAKKFYKFRINTIVLCKLTLAYSIHVECDTITFKTMLLQK